MKALSLCLLLAISITTYGQEPGAVPRGPAPGQAQPDTSGARLQQLLRRASELQRAGQPELAAAVLQQAEWERQALLRHLDALQAEVERIRQIVGARPQVLVTLQVFEVSLTKLKKLGFDVTKLQGNAATAPGGVKKETAPGGFSLVNDSNEAGRIIEALHKDNLAKVLAEPRLVTLSGQTAKLHTGGELSLPTPQSDGSTHIDRQPYGTEVELTPTVLGNRTVRLAIRGRISELDYVNVTRIGKDVFPGVRTREFATNAELQSGQVMALSGLSDVRTETEAHGLPLVSEIPFAGAMFRSVKETRNEIALLVLIRPEILDAPNALMHVGHAGPTTAVAPRDVGPRR